MGTSSRSASWSGRTDGT